jgi:hypothetical protein
MEALLSGAVPVVKAVTHNFSIPNQKLKLREEYGLL